MFENYKLSWYPVISWKCNDCKADFYPSNNIKIKDIRSSLNIDEPEQIECIWYEQYKKIIFIAEVTDYCSKCGKKINYTLLINCTEFNKDSEEFSNCNNIILDSNDLEYTADGFIFRGCDILYTIPELLLHWWYKRKKIIVVNPFITDDGMKTLLDLTSIPYLYCNQLSKFSAPSKFFYKILMQNQQGYSNVIKIIDKLVQKQQTEDTYECFSGWNPKDIKEALYLTNQPDSLLSMINDKDFNIESRFKNSGKFHAKLYAALDKNNSELLITSYNLTEGEKLQMETVIYEKELSEYVINSELSKIFNDNRMDVEKIKC